MAIDPFDLCPQFETPLPPLQPAVFPPAIREPPPPALELFDLDESFASEHVSGGCEASLGCMLAWHVRLSTQKPFMPAAPDT